MKTALMSISIALSKAMKNSFSLLVLVATFAALPKLSIAQSDTTAPALSALSFGTSVDVSTAPQNLAVNATISDDLSGLNYSYIQFVSPSGQFVYAYFNRVAGTNLNGTYSAAVTFPRFVQPGSWTAFIVAYDNAGNHVTLSSANLISLGFPGAVTVVDTSPDNTPPSLLGVSFSPSTIDTSNGPVAVTVNLQVSDSQTGAAFNQGAFAITLSPASAGPSGPLQYLSDFDFRLVSGTTQNGVWQATKMMPRYSGGNWIITQVTLYDAVTNHITLTPTQLTAMGINPGITDTSIPADSTPPTLTSFSSSPSVIDTSGAGQNVTVTVSATDDISGVDFAPATPNLAAIYHLYFFSPSGNQFVAANPYTIPPLVAGTTLAGTWQLTASWPQYSEQGTWNLGLITVEDKVGSTRSYSPSQLQSMGFPTSIVVTKPSLTSDGSVGFAGGTVNDNSFGSRASVTFPAGLVSSPTTVSIDVFPSPLSVPTPRGFTMPGTYFENISFVPALPEPVPAPGITVVLPLLTPLTPGAMLSLYHIDPIVGLAPAMNASGHPVVGVVNPDRVSATFNNVVTFSTVVAFLSNGSVLGDVNGDGMVNCADVSILKGSFGKNSGQTGFNSAADLNNDGTLNILDLFIISKQLPTGTVCQ